MAENVKRPSSKKHFPFQEQQMVPEVRGYKEDGERKEISGR